MEHGSGVVYTEKKKNLNDKETVSAFLGQERRLELEFQN